MIPPNIIGGTYEHVTCGPSHTMLLPCLVLRLEKKGYTQKNKQFDFLKARISFRQNGSWN
jgi:hypothetical protein